MPTEDMTLTEKEKIWIKKFRTLMRSKPKEIELILSYNSMTVYPTGTLKKHIGSEHDGWDITTNPDLEGTQLTEFRVPITSYNEGV